MPREWPWCSNDWNLKTPYFVHYCVLCYCILQQHVLQMFVLPYITTRHGDNGPLLFLSLPERVRRALRINRIGIIQVSAKPPHSSQDPGNTDQGNFTSNTMTYRCKANLSVSVYCCLQSTPSSRQFDSTSIHSKLAKLGTRCLFHPVSYFLHLKRLIKVDFHSPPHCSRVGWFIRVPRAPVAQIGSITHLAIFYYRQFPQQSF